MPVALVPDNGCRGVDAFASRQKNVIAGAAASGDCLGCLVYEWGSPKNPLFHTLVPWASKLQAIPGEGAADVLARISPQTRSFAFHLNLTDSSRIPIGRAELVASLVARGCRVLNASPSDIGKRTLQRTCVALGLGSAVANEEGDDQELVIVKTDQNFGGHGDRRLHPSIRDALGIRAPSMMVRRSKDYRILRRREVPSGVWFDPSLVVERFIVNDRQEKVRAYVAGEHLVISIISSPDAIKKFRNDLIRQNVLVTRGELSESGLLGSHESARAALQKLIEGLQLDFGAIDVVEDNEFNAWVVDVNVTPVWRDLDAEMRPFLREGIEAIVGARVPGADKLGSFVNSIWSRRSELVRQAPHPVESSRRRSVSRRSRGASNESVQLIAPAQRYEAATDVAVIMAFFNPEGFRSKIRNFELCAAVLDRSGVPWACVECASGGTPHTLAQRREIVRVRCPSPLWQKERLLNMLVRRLPERFTKVAWLDADVFFANPRWIVQTSEALEQYRVLQPFDMAVRLPPRVHEFNGLGSKIEAIAAVSARQPDAILTGDFGLHGHSGFAWAAHREMVEQYGLYDAAIIGGGDHLMAHAFLGDWDSACVDVTVGTRGHPFQNHFERWASAVYPSVRAQVGCVSGAVLHLWHGEILRRGYATRHEGVLTADFDPNVDIRVSDVGCWEWSTDKPGLHEHVANYFRSRREDADTPVAQMRHEQVRL